MEWAAAWGPIILFPFMLIGIYIYRTLQALLYAAIGLVFNSSAGTSLEFPAILSLSMVAVTPALVLSAFLGVLGVELPYGWLMYFALAMVCLFFAIKATHPRPGDDADDHGLDQPPEDGQGDQPGSPEGDKDLRDMFLS